MGEERRKKLKEIEKPEGAPKCYGTMFRENGNLRYGSMSCDEEFCEFSEKCRKDSERRRK